MPTYEYRCSNCDTLYQKVRGISESTPKYKCDTCNLPLIRVYSNIGINFKGSGFYSTDK